MSNLSRTGTIGFLAFVSMSMVMSMEAKLMEDTVAMVNGTPIMLSEYQKELATAMDYWARGEPEALRDPANVKKLRESTLDELINRELLYQEGTKLKIKVRERDVENGMAEIRNRFLPPGAGESPTPDQQAAAEAAFKKQLESDGLSYSQFRDRLGKQVMARKLIDEVIRPKVGLPSESEVREYFESIKKYLASKSTAAPAGLDEESALAFRQIAQQIKVMSSERVRVSRILVRISPGASENERKRALKAAADIRGRLAEGTASFAELAKNESEDAESAQKGGDIGYVVRGVAPPEFEKVAFSIELGAISEPILTDLGYHVIRVSEKRVVKASNKAL